MGLEGHERTGSATGRRARRTRRELLAGMGTAGLAVGLGACQVSTKSDGTSGGGPSKTPKVVVPTSEAKLPTQKVKFGWMDSGGLKAMFEEPMFAAYHKAHPNISIQYDGIQWEKINEAIPLGVRNGTAPDVFAKPTDVPTQVLINENWVAPIDDIVPDFDSWKAAFPETAFIPGVHIFNDRVYTWPTSSSKRYSHMLMCDRLYLADVGLDPTKEQLTWDGFRAACRKITKKGNGDYYGLMVSGQHIGDVAAALAELAGLRGGTFDWKTGHYAYNDPALYEALDLLRAVKSDGSFFPGAIGLSTADARARMPQRVAGMIFEGPWCIPEWTESDPSYKFEIAMPPVPDPKKPHYAAYQELGSNQVWVFAKGKHKQVAGDLFSYLGSVEGQTQLVEFSKGNLASVIPKANKAADPSRLSDRAIAAQDIADRLMRMAPMVQLRNPDTAQVILEEKAITPSFADICQGAFTGQIDNLKDVLKQLNDKSEADLDQAVKAARKKGAKVSRDDWAFPNWDPSEDYTEDAYRKLPG